MVLKPGFQLSEFLENYFKTLQSAQASTKKETRMTDKMWHGMWKRLVEIHPVFKMLAMSAYGVDTTNDALELLEVDELAFVNHIKMPYTIYQFIKGDSK